MSSSLLAATNQSLDTPDLPPPTLGSRVSSGQRGRPPVHIPPEELAALNVGRTTRQDIADMYQCSSRTIRRRLLEFGLSPPGPPIYVELQVDGGSLERRYVEGRRGLNSDLSQLSDPELDEVMKSIHDQFPSFGRALIDGYLLVLGERVPRRRIEESYLRVVGMNQRTFGPRRIERRVYSVPAPYSLVHHDGQHGMFNSNVCSKSCQDLILTISHQVSFVGRLSSMLLLMDIPALSLEYEPVTITGRPQSWTSLKKSPKNTAIPAV